jgi:hypothetical protein
MVLRWQALVAAYKIINAAMRQNYVPAICYEYQRLTKK